MPAVDMMMMPPVRPIIELVRTTPKAVSVGDVTDPGALTGMQAFGLQGR